MNRILQRVTALIMVFALVLSMACSAGAVEVSEAIKDEQLTVVEADASEQEEPTEEAPEQESAEAAEAAEEAAEEVEPEDEAPAAEDIQEEAEEAEEEDLLAASYLATGWEADYNDETGDVELSFTYAEDGKLVSAADGYYSIPESADVQIGGKGYTFLAGIYAFDEDGICQQEQAEDNVNVSVSEVNHEDGVYTVSDASVLEVTLGGVSYEEEVISSEAELFTGVEELDGSYRKFKNGEDKGSYTGTFLHEDLNKVCYAKAGVLLNSTGSFHWYDDALYSFDKMEDGAAVGKAFTGARKLGSVPASQSDEYDAGVVYYFENGKAVEDDKSYHWYQNKLYYFNDSASQKAGFSVGKPYTGRRTLGSVPADVTGYKKGGVYDFMDGVGTGITGYMKSKLTYYKSGLVDTAMNGWKTISGKTYYFENGKACADWNYVKRNGKTYKYFFREDGSLVNDLYAYFGKSYYSKKQRIYVNRWSNNITIFQYNADTGDYDIPLKSMVCSTSKTTNWRYGVYPVYKLARWYHKGKWHWQYLTRIGNTGALFHSCRYYRKNIRTMQSTNYNTLGGRNSDKCVRAGVGACRLIYNIVLTQKSGNVTCKYFYAKDYGPFGHVTLANTTGKVKGKQAKDPTE